MKDRKEHKIMKLIYTTGGREQYFKGQTGDCVTRAIANATGKDYKEVYNALFELTRSRRNSKRRPKQRGESPRNGIYTHIAKKYIEGVLGWEWIPLMFIGSGCQVHLRADELPSKGNLIVKVSKHFTCVKDGVLYDTFDCSRDGNRCVYGYWKKS
jgi:hypothetical protein